MKLLVCVLVWAVAASAHNSGKGGRSNAETETSSNAITILLTPSSGIGLAALFSAEYTDVDGTPDLQTVYLLFNNVADNTTSGANACLVQYSPSTNSLYLNDNADDGGLSTAVIPGSATSVSNSQCTLSGAYSSVSSSGNSLTVTYAITFASTFAGTKNAFADAVSNNNGYTGFVSEGTWTVAQGTPTAASLTPNSGAGLSQTFSAVYYDPDGASNLRNVYLLFNTSINAANACYVQYNRATNSLYLNDNAGDGGLSVAVAPGSSSSVSNSQCTLHGTGSSVTTSLNALTLQYSITFADGFAGAKNSYLCAAEDVQTSGFQYFGTWTVAQGEPSAVSLTPSSGTGLTQIFTAVYSDTNGPADLQTVYLLINRSLNGENACYVQYSPATNSLYLNSDAGNGGLSVAVTPGSSSSVSNSQCTLSGGGSSATRYGNDLDVSYAITFAASFSGMQNSYLYATGSRGGSGWVQEGTWTVAALPSTPSLTPNSGAGFTQTFTAVYSDPNGAADLRTVYLLIGSYLSAVNACYVQYSPATNSLYLNDNAGDGGLSAAVTPGSFSSVSNSQCTLSGTGSSVTLLPNSVTVSYNISFASGFAGAKNAYLYAAGSATSSGWTYKGSWTVGTPVLGPVYLSPSSGTGVAQAFTAEYSDPNGVSDLQTLYLLFNTAINGSNACYVQYSVATNSLYLNDNSGDGGLSAGVTPGSSATVSNSQCTLSGTGSSVNTSIGSVTVTYNITFAPGFAGTKNAYVYAGGSSGNSGWSQEGTWTVASTSPGPSSLAPNSGTGLAQTFSAVYSDQNGVSDLQTVYLLFNTSINGANACYVQYSPATNRLYLNNNAGTELSAAVTPGASATVSNSQCTLSGSGSSVTTAGNNLTVTYAVTFASGFAGTKNAYLYAAGGSDSAGWVLEGAWTVGFGTPSTPSLTPSEGIGLSQTFTAMYSDPNGAADLRTLYLMINTSLNGASACYVEYNQATGSLYLNDNADDGGLSMGVTPGSSSSVSNSQCTLSGTGSSVTASVFQSKDEPGEDPRR